jgi:signal transduction histidine kinase
MEPGRESDLNLFFPLLASHILEQFPYPLCAVDKSLNLLCYSNSLPHYIPSMNGNDLHGLPLLDYTPESIRHPFHSAINDLQNHGHLKKDYQINLPCSEFHDPHPFHVQGYLLQNIIEEEPVVLIYCVPVFHMLDHTEQMDAARLDAVKQLAVTLNHEINNPLFIISMTLEDMLAEENDPAVLRRLRASLDAVWRVSNAVKQLQELRKVVITDYAAGLSMVDLEASQ